MIEVFDPIIGEEEIEAVVAALRRGEISGSFGESIPRFEEEFAAYCGCKYGVAVSSGSTALHLAVAAAGIGAGDEVLVSSSTNIATALAVIHNQAIPVPVDSESLTWNLDLDLIEDLITEKTKAIIPVHLYGHPVDMDRLMEIARRHNLLVIEDCAESHGATCRGRMTGSFGDMACFSFYANKVITTGEGGMITTNNAELAERLCLLRNLAFTKPRFRHEEAGFNFRMTGIQAAMGRAQFAKIDHILSEKRRVAHTYNEFLRDVDGLQLPHEAEWARNVYWMYSVVVQPEFGITRDQLMDSLRAAEIDTRTFFCPMNQQPCLLALPDFRAVPCPVADGLWDNGLYLPSTYSLSEDVIKQVAGAVKAAAQSQKKAMSLL
jgi:perosamine synthetase